MTAAALEHVNVTAANPKAMAQELCDLFGWKIRWEGAAMQTGYTVHVGTDSGYVAVYGPGGDTQPAGNTYAQRGGLNHIGVTVDDLDVTEAQVKKAGYTPHNHGDYEPGRRFYFDGPEGIEFEVVSYA